MDEVKKTRLQRLKEEQSVLRREIREKTIGYILAALGLVAGLAWNEAIKGLIDQFFPNTGNGVLLKFLYAVIITIVVVVVTVYLVKLTQKEEIK
jgi:hypothetical protein